MQFVYPLILKRIQVDYLLLCPATWSQVQIPVPPKTNRTEISKSTRHRKNEIHIKIKGVN